MRYPLTPEQFWNRVERGSGCWPWLGAQNGVGYGHLYRNKIHVYAHRHAYELTYGNIPPGYVVDHLCRNPICCRPDHLEPVTHAVNVRRGRGGDHNRRKTHCPRGHEYTPKNTRLYRGCRFCRACSRTRDVDR